jgi:hypothetical protein
MTRRGLSGSSPKSSSLGLLPCLVDYRVHAVYDPVEAYPLAVCGLHICPDTYLPNGVLLCRRCLAALSADASVRPAVNERRILDKSKHAEFLVRFWRWWLTHYYGWCIRRALAAERRHG